MTGTVTPLRRRLAAAPPADPMAYSPPFPAELKAAMAALNGANSQVQCITSGNFTTVGLAHSLPDLLTQVIQHAQAARRVL